MADTIVGTPPNGATVYATRVTRKGTWAALDTMREVFGFIPTWHFADAAVGRDAAQLLDGGMSEARERAISRGCTWTMQWMDRHLDEFIDMQLAFAQAAQEARSTPTLKAVG